MIPRTPKRSVGHDLPPMSTLLPDAGIPYHRLGRGSKTRWWRPLVGTLAVLILFLVVAVGLTVAVYAIYEPDLHRGASTFAQAWELGLWLAAIAIAIPATMLVARCIDRRPAGSLSSVAGAIRWRWLGTCTGVAAAAYAVLIAASVGIDPLGDVDVPLVVAVFAVSVAFVPMQAAGEEYLFRGYFAQAVGSYVRNPWIPALLISLLFGLAHGSLSEQGGGWALIDRFVFGLVAAWLTIRTGGLEAAIALHAIGNIFGITATAAYGELLDYLVGPEQRAEAWEVLLDIAVMVGIALVLARVARRRGIATHRREDSDPSGAVSEDLVLPENPLSDRTRATV
jgi:membrane protease YdiL (CAAX protease family)